MTENVIICTITDTEPVYWMIVPHVQNELYVWGKVRELTNLIGPKCESLLTSSTNFITNFTFGVKFANYNERYNRRERTEQLWFIVN